MSIVIQRANTFLDTRVARRLCDLEPPISRARGELPVNSCHTFLSLLVSISIRTQVLSVSILFAQEYTCSKQMTGTIEGSIVLCIFSPAAMNPCVLHEILVKLIRVPTCRSA